MRRRTIKAVLLYLLFILLVLVLAWWIAGDIYKPYPPATPTPTPGYWPTRITATIIPSATATEVIVTPIQPTIGYTATPYEPPVTVTSTPEPIFTQVLTSTPTVASLYPIQKSIDCEMLLFKNNRVIHYLWCRVFGKDRPPALGTPPYSDIITWPPEATTWTAIPITDSPIFTP